MNKPWSLPHLTAFAAAARLGSFTAAADALFLTPGAISRHIRALEERAGCPLFTRGHRSVTLTEQGAAFAETVAGVLAQLAAAEARLSEAPTLKTLYVDCLPTFAMYWLTPRLADFERRHPDIHLQLTTSIGEVQRNLTTDLSIRRDPRHFAGLNGVPFLTEYCLLAASARVASAQPVDLLQWPLIDIRARDDLWETWLAAQGSGRPADARRLPIDHTFAAIQAVEDGLGVAVLPTLFCQRQIAAGRLQALADRRPVRSGTYSALVHRPNPGPVVLAFIAWLQQQGDGPP